MNPQKPIPSISFFIDSESDSFVAAENTDEGTDIESVRLPLSEMRSREPEELQRTIGRLVLSFLDARTKKGLGLPRDLEDERRLDEEHWAQLALAARTGDPSASYAMGVDLIAKGISTETWADIERGEMLLQSAVDAGLPMAVKYQTETWSLIRPRLEQKLKGRRAE